VISWLGNGHAMTAPTVIPAHAGIQKVQESSRSTNSNHGNLGQRSTVCGSGDSFRNLDSRFRGNDGVAVFCFVAAKVNGHGKNPQPLSSI
jgi:hypothetical protein